jgi:hypothetical protein
LLAPADKRSALIQTLPFATSKWLCEKGSNGIFNDSSIIGEGSLPEKMETRRVYRKKSNQKFLPSKEVKGPKLNEGCAPLAHDGVDPATLAEVNGVSLLKTRNLLFSSTLDVFSLLTKDGFASRFLVIMGSHSFFKKFMSAILISDCNNKFISSSFLFPYNSKLML